MNGLDNGGKRWSLWRSPFFSFLFVQRTINFLTSKFIYRSKVSKVGNFEKLEKFDQFQFVTGPYFSNGRANGNVISILRVQVEFSFTYAWVEWILNFSLGREGMLVGNLRFSTRKLCDQIYSSIIFVSSFIYLLGAVCTWAEKRMKRNHGVAYLPERNKEEKNRSIGKKLW